MFLTTVAIAETATAARLDTPDWRRAIRSADKSRLARLYPAWTASRTAATAKDDAAWLALGPLVDPAAALSGDWPTAGTYRCRTVRLGATVAGMPAIAPQPAMPCRIAVDSSDVGNGRVARIDLSMASGAQRSTGRLYPDGDRMIYLGAVSLRDDVSGFDYGSDPDRNQVGVLERIGPSRWRLALPWPRWQSILEVVEIAPAD